MITVAIIEDDQTATLRLKAFLEEFSARNGDLLDIVEFPGPTGFLSGYRPIYDVVFMDIEMPLMDGMTAARRLRELDAKVILIFVTNMAQFAAKGYEVEAMDYIIKPLVYADFERKFKRVVSACNHNSTSLIVSHQGGSNRVLLREIQYIEVRGHSLLLHTESGIVQGAGTLRDIEQRLGCQGFLRCSKAYLVNHMYVRAVRGSMLIMTSGEQFSIGRSFKQSFMAGLADYIGETRVI